MAGLSLSPIAQHRLFVLGVGVTACAAVELMRRLLIQYREAALLPTPEDKTHKINQAVEDSLKLSTLDKLLNSPNYCIQETASIIVRERALYDKTTINTLLWHITRPDHDTRERGLKALKMVIDSTTIRMIDEPATYAALVQSLEYSLTDYDHPEYDMEWDNWPFRDVAEQDCLSLLTQLVETCGPDGLIKARFIERWLAKEPWGSDDGDRQINFLESLKLQNRLAELTRPLIRDPIARKLLRKVNLLPEDFEWDSPSPKDVRMVNGESTAGEDFDWMLVEGRRRTGQSPREEGLRRRNREAMVLNDGTRPFGMDDIIQRDR